MAGSFDRVQKSPRRLLTAAVGIAIALAMHPVVAQTPDPTADPAVMEMMVKNALAALNHANITGNYTVLRDLGAEEFRRRNTAADLAKSFANHREKHYDLSPILCAAPHFTQPPALAESGRLVLIGYFDTRPEVVQFAVAYQRSPSGWGLHEITVAMAPNAETAHAPADSNR